MASKIKIKRSAVAGKVPLTTDLELSELAVNTNDGRLYTKKDNGTESIVEIGGPDFGSRNVTTTGTSTAASFIPTSSTVPTNGVYLPAANSVSISTNSTGRLFIDSSGRLSLGTGSTTRTAEFTTTSGNNGLRVSNSGNTASDFAVFDLVQSNAQKFVIYTNQENTTAASSGSFILQAGAAERLRITSAGLVGIGTSSPQTQLHINGGYDGSVTNRLTFSTTFDGNANSGSGIYFKNYYNNARITAFSNPASGQGGTLQLQTYNSDVSLNTGIVLDNAGRVGIGTTAPSNELYVLAPPSASSFDGITLDNGTRAALGLYVTGSAYSYGSVGANQSWLYCNSGDLNITSDDTGVIKFSGDFALERARIDSSGRLLVGTSSTNANTKLIVQGGASTNSANVYFARADATPANGDPLGYLIFSDSNHGDAAYFHCARDGGTWNTSTSRPTRLVFSTTADGASSPVERMRITNGGFIQITDRANDPLPDSTSPSGDNAFDHLTLSTNGVNVSRQASPAIDANRRGAADGAVIALRRSGTLVGTISVSGSATAYNTSSDYRLKENVVAVTDGIARLQQLKPSRFNFIADPGKTVDGFLAHEVQEVVPEAITGDKDAVDADGNPVYQGIDQSKLVPLLTAALQEAVARIEQLETTVATLQGS